MYQLLMFEVFAVFVSYIGSFFIGVANRNDAELKVARIVFFVLILLVVNIIFFFSL